MKKITTQEMEKDRYFLKFLFLYLIIMALHILVGRYRDLIFKGILHMRTVYEILTFYRCI